LLQRILPATGTEEYEQVPCSCDTGGMIPNPGMLSGDGPATSLRDRPVFQEKQVVFRRLKEPLYFQAIAVVRRAPDPGTDCWLSGYCAFSNASKEHGFFAIKTGIF